jgi:hypothetical protein
MIMLLKITSNRLISDIQKDFNEEFPFLKIVFFNKKSISSSDYSAKQIIPQNKKIGEIQINAVDGNIEIEEEMKVNKLENIFKDQFNLAVQVFRKSGNLWLETTMTDNWTLQQQNNHGREISTSQSSNDKADDFDLTRDSR